MRVETAKNPPSTIVAIRKNRKTPVRGAPRSFRSA